MQKLCNDLATADVLEAFIILPLNVLIYCFFPCSFDRQRVVDRRERYRQVRAFLNSGKEISFGWHSCFASYLTLHFVP